MADISKLEQQESFADEEEDIDNLVKEMEGDSNERS